MPAYGQASDQTIDVRKMRIGLLRQVCNTRAISFAGCSNLANRIAPIAPILRAPHRHVKWCSIAVADISSNTGNTAK